MKLHFEIELPEGLVKEFLQYMRDFDMKHDPNHEGIVKQWMTMESHQSIQAVKDMFQSIKPTPEFIHDFQVKKFDN